MPLSPAIPRKRPAPLQGFGGALRSLAPWHPAAVAADIEEERLANAFCGYVGARHAVPVAGARVGLWAALDHVRQHHGPGEVVVPALTATIVPNVVASAGLEPRFVDVDAHTFSAGHEDLLAAVGPKTRAVVATHLEGFPVRADLLAGELYGGGVLLVEDAAHALGAEVCGRMVGTLGDAAIFSLGKGKQLNAVAGGVLTTRHRELAAHAAELQSCVAPPGRLQVLRTLALARAMDLATRRGAFDLMLWPGLRGAARMGSDPLTDLFEDNPGPLPVTGPPAAHRRLGGAQAILAREGLARYPVALKRRREIWRRLVEAAERGGCTVQRPTAETAPAPLEVALRTPNRARAQADLRARGIDSQRTWMAAPSSLPAFAANAGGPFPVAEALAKELLYLPFYPGLEDAEVERLEATLERPPPSLRFHFP